MSDLVRVGHRVPGHLLEVAAEESLYLLFGPVGHHHQARGDNVHGDQLSSPIAHAYRMGGGGLVDVVDRVAVRNGQPGSFSGELG